MGVLEELVHLVEQLRGENGCPWDKRQTLETLAPYLLEESREVVDAVASGVAEDICEELGDVLLIVTMMARVAEEQGVFTIGDSAKSICEKIIRRHPHVFGDVEVSGEEDIVRNWNQIKEEEKRLRGRK